MLVKWLQETLLKRGRLGPLISQTRKWKLTQHIEQLRKFSSLSNQFLLRLLNTSYFHWARLVQITLSLEYQTKTGRFLGWQAKKTRWVQDTTHWVLCRVALIPNSTHWMLRRIALIKSFNKEGWDIQREVINLNLLFF